MHGYTAASRVLLLLLSIPGTYIPRKEVEQKEVVRATVIKPNQAIKLRARKETMVSHHSCCVPVISAVITGTPPLISTQDRDGNPRVTGEEWLVKKVGAYLPGAYEEVVDIVDAYILTEKVREEWDSKEGRREGGRERCVASHLGSCPPRSLGGPAYEVNSNLH